MGVEGRVGIFICHSQETEEEGRQDTAPLEVGMDGWTPSGTTMREP